MSYYTEQEATRINREIKGLKPLIEKYLAERLQKTLDKFNLTGGHIKYEGRFEPFQVDFFNCDLDDIFDEAYESLIDSISEDVFHLIHNYNGIEISVGDYDNGQ